MSDYSGCPDELRNHYKHQISVLEERKKIFGSKKKCYIKMYNLLEKTLGQVKSSAKQLQSNMVGLYLKKRELRSKGLEVQLRPINDAVYAHKNFLDRVRQNYCNLKSKADSAASSIIAMHNRIKSTMCERDECIGRLEELGRGY